MAMTRLASLSLLPLLALRGPPGCVFYAAAAAASSFATPPSNSRRRTTSLHSGDDIGGGASGGSAPLRRRTARRPLSLQQRRRPCSRLHWPACRPLPAAASDDDLNDEDFAYMEERNRMKMVRMLQDAYYSSSGPGDDEDSSTAAALGEDGSIRNLPLWRVGWTELPGRSNVLSVHEGRYTHMFETILRTDEPRYVGHLYLPEGSTSLEGEVEERHQLRSWEEEAARREKEGIAGAKDRSAVVGTLLRILDFRRMSNGRMLLLVQALDRFVVTSCVRELPYAIANVQLLLEKEDESSDSRLDDDTSQRAVSSDYEKGRVLMRSLRWYGYESDTKAKLPVRNDKRDDLVATDVIGSELKGCMPFLPCSPSMVALDDDMLRDGTAGTDSGSEEMDKSLEQRLEDSDILHSSSNRMDDYSLSIDDIEDRVWLLIDEFVRIRKLTSIPNKLLALLPRDRSWPSEFVLNDFAERLCKDDPSFVWFDDTYPSERRQKMLSYSSYALIETTRLGTRYRQKLLEMRGIKDRLLEIIELFQNVNSDILGEFL